MRIVLLYIAVAGGPITENHCAKFVTTYHDFPPGIEHETIIVSQGGPLPTSTSVLFEGMNVKMWPHANSPGWDVSAYLDASRGPCHDADIMLCLGESVYFHRAGWFKRLLEAWEKFGPGMYGPFSSNYIRAHLQTTAFCCAPSLLREFPLPVNNRADRMAFEHGPHAFWRYVQRRGMPVRLVTWDGEYEPRFWRGPPDIHYRGTQANCLMWCNHSDGFAKADPKTKVLWSQCYDQRFQ